MRPGSRDAVAEVVAFRAADGREHTVLAALDRTDKVAGVAVGSELARAAVAKLHDPP